MAALKRLPLLSGADEVELVRIAEKVVDRRFAKGEVLVKEGSKGSDVFFIVSGVCEVRRTLGGQEKALATLGPGQFFGEIAVLSPDLRTATVAALEEVTAFTLSAWEFREALHGSPTTAYQVMKELAGRIRKLEERLATLEGSAARNQAAAPPTSHRKR